MDPYPSIGSVASGLSVVQPICNALCSGDAGGIHEVYPLADVTSVEVQPCMSECMGSKTAGDTLVVKVCSHMGGMMGAAAIDGPANGEKFASMVMEQKEASKNSGFQIPPDVMEEYTKVRSQPSLSK